MREASPPSTTAIAASQIRDASVFKTRGVREGIIEAGELSSSFADRSTSGEALPRFSENV